MKYEPVKLLTLFKVIVDTKAGTSYRSPFYYQVRSASLGTCGHEHTTAKAADPCFKRMSREFSRLRSEKSTAAWAKRKQVQVCD